MGYTLNGEYLSTYGIIYHKVNQFRGLKNGSDGYHEQKTVFQTAGVLQ